MVLDHDPEMISMLESRGTPYTYGDASDPDLLEDLKIPHAELVISTVPDLETNLIILSAAKQKENPPTVMVLAHRITNALELYDAGADYVILPHFLGGTYAASLVRRYAKEAVDLHDIRDKHIDHLRTRMSNGQEHPEIDRLR